MPIEEGATPVEGAQGEGTQGQGNFPANPLSTDAQDKGSAPVKERPKSKRELALESIKAQRHASFEEESGVKIEPATPATEPATEPAAAPAAAEPATSLEQPNLLETGLQLGRQLEDGTIELSQADLARLRVRVKVDGNEELVDATKALGQYQKGAAAEVRLEAATKARADAERLLREAQAKLDGADTAREKAAASKEVAVAAENLGAKKQEMFDALYGGDAEKAGRLFDEAVSAAVEKTLSGRSTGATPNVEEIARQAAALAVPAIKQVTSRESALANLRQDYPEIFTDPDLVSATDRRINERLTDGVEIGMAILDAGQEVAKKFGLRKVSERSSAGPSTTTRSEKLAAKKEGLDEPTATAARSATNVAPPKTASDVIADIARARGQRV